jgi:PhnB protein
MARVSTWLHSAGSAEVVFNFYKSVFKTEFVAPIVHFGDLPTAPGQPPWPADQAKPVMKVALPILGGHVIIGNDAPASMGQRIQGNNVTLNLEPDTRADVDRLFAALKVGGSVEYEPTEMPWGGYWGSLIDR